MDLDLLIFLALPVLVCTCDARLRRLADQVGSWQASWILTPAQLASAAGGAEPTGDASFASLARRVAAQGSSVSLTCSSTSMTLGASAGPSVTA